MNCDRRPDHGSVTAFAGRYSSSNLAKKAIAKKGIDVSAYVSEAADPNATFLFPITDHARSFALHERLLTRFC
jgi:hypothetical protein